MSRRLPVNALVPGAVLALALASNAAAMDAASSQLGRLDVWQGHWKFEADRKATPFSRAEVETGEGKCAWLPNHGYMVCDYLGDKIDPDEGAVPNNLVIFSYNRAAKNYNRIFMSREGSQDWTVAIAGNIWTAMTEVPRQKGGTADLRDTYDFVSPAKVMVKTEISIDKGAHWTEISETGLTKVG